MRLMILLHFITNVPNVVSITATGGMWRRAAAVNNNRDQKKNSHQVLCEVRLATERETWFVELALNALIVFVIACCAILYCLV